MLPSISWALIRSWSPDLRTPFQHVAHAKVARDLPEVDRPALNLKLELRAMTSRPAILKDP